MRRLSSAYNNRLGFRLIMEKTWFEKYYGFPPPEKKKVHHKLPELLQQDEKQIKESAWYRAKHDYMEDLRKQNEKT